MTDPLSNLFSITYLLDSKINFERKEHITDEENVSTRTGRDTEGAGKALATNLYVKRCPVSELFAFR